MRRVLLLTICCALALLAWTPALAADTDPFGFSEDQYSAWGIVDAPYPYEGYDADGKYIDYGCFPVGNGLVFGHLGVDSDFNTLRGLTGPGYQTREDDGAWAVWKEGNWPDMHLAAKVIPGKQVDWKTQSIQQLRGAAMVQTTQSSSVGTLSTLTYAIPGQPIIIREFALDSKAAKAPTIAIQIDNAQIDINELVLQQGDDELTIQPSKTSVSGDVLSVLLEQDAEGIWRGTIALIATKKRPRPAIDLDTDSVVSHRNTTYNHWQNWSAQNLKFDTGDNRLDDMMAQLPVIIETQRDYYSGSTSPMVSYHGCWVRDNNGPILTYLANGRFAEVKRILRYHRACCKKYGSSQMMVPLDMDLSDMEGWIPSPVGQASVLTIDSGSQAETLAPPNQLTQPERTAGDLSGIGTKPEDWEGTPVEHAEVPSLIVLQHYWLWRAMHDAGLGDEADAFIAEAWAFISHNLFTMTFHPDYGVYFHGDETYTQGALYSTYDRVESGQIGYPNGYIPTQDYTSFDNTILHRAACNAAYYMAGALEYEPNELRSLGDQTEVQDDIIELLMKVENAKLSFLSDSSFAPAIATFTGQRWPDAFSNLSLSPWSVGFPYQLYGPQQYIQSRVDLYKTPGWTAAGEPAISWWTTPDSGYATGHALGTLLNAARNNGDNEAVLELEGLLVTTATPEGAWCEVLNADGFPVDIYGRVNRIRPWESGINYVLMAAHLLDKKQAGGNTLLDFEAELLKLYSSNAETPEFFANFEKPLSGKEWHRTNGATDFPSLNENTSLLGITKSHDWLEQISLDSRLRNFSDNRITAWDAGMPLSVDDLRDAVFDSVGQAAVPAINESQARQPAPPRITIPYLYFDRGVQGGLDRRTMKDHDFWHGEEMQTLLAEYKAAGGTVITPDTMQMRLAYDEVVELKLLVALFPNTFTHRMSDAEIENFHHEVAEWIAWYDDVANSRINLKLDFIQIDTLLNEQMSGPQGDNVYWMGHDDVEEMLTARGVKLDHYDNVCAFWGWDRDNGALPGGEKANQAYGGAAQGPGNDMEFLGKSKRTGYFGSAVLTDKPDGISKVALHEFLHNLDAMLEMCGEPRLSHPDQMSRQMETLLSEVPGGFKHLDLSDDDMRDMVEAELRDEIHYPWPTQLVYYKQAIERVNRGNYGALLKYFGERKKKSARTRLYENYILPEGTSAYQIAYAESSGFTKLQLDDQDFVNEGDLVWKGEAWGGYLHGETDSQTVQRYFEAQIDYPSLVSFTLGDEPAINPGLLDLGTDTGVPGAQMWLELDGHRLNFFNMGGYEYTADLPMDTGRDVSATLYATKDGYVITPRPVEFEIKPPWELEAGFGLSSRNLPELTIMVNGLPGEYLVEGRATTRFNTVQNLLVDDGLLKRVEQVWAIKVMDGDEASISISPSTFETISRIPIEIQVTYLSDTRKTSFKHELRGAGNIPAMLEHVSEKNLPDYIPRCHRITPKMDGMLSEWTSEPSIILTPDNGNIFSGEVESKADAAVVLWLGYDDDYLYVAGGVRDDMTPGNGSWDSDRINLCFDALTDTTQSTYPDGAVGHTGWAKDDFWVFLNPLLPEGPKSMRLGGERPSGGKNGYYGEVVGANAVVINEDEGAYRFEWAIPLDSLPHLSPEPNTFCGFTMFYSDYDESLSEMMYVTDWGGESGIDWRFWDCGLLYFE